MKKKKDGVLIRSIPIKTRRLNLIPITFRINISLVCVFRSIPCSTPVYPDWVRKELQSLDHSLHKLLYASHEDHLV